MLRYLSISKVALSDGKRTGKASGTAYGSSSHDLSRQHYFSKVTRAQAFSLTLVQARHALAISYP
jgi:hypothetical protein